MSVAFSTNDIYSQRNYFNDGIRKVDFVLVSFLIKTPEELDIIVYFLSELLKVGIEYEFDVGKDSAKYVFIKIHCPQKTLEDYAQYHGFIFDYLNPIDLNLGTRFFPCKLFHNVTTRHNPGHHAYHRAFGTLSNVKPQSITSWERSLITYRILLKTKFSNNPHDEGVNMLIVKGLLKDAYPLHDGIYEWKKLGPLTDCQLLYRYWANMKAIFKHQPISLIYKYYGPEVTFYFVHTEFYTKMLIIPAIVGFLLFIFNLVMRNYLDTDRVTEICHSEQRLCTLCFKVGACNFAPVKNSCVGAKIIQLFDNLGGGIFAFFMGFWSIAYVDLWRRREYMLQYRWNLLQQEYDTTYRLEFLKANHPVRISSVSGEKEYYIPLKTKLVNWGRNTCGLALMIGTVLIVILCTIIYRVQITKLINNSDMDTIKLSKPLFIMTTSSFMATATITFLDPYFKRLSIHLTDKENPKTYFRYYYSCIYKVFTTTFVNNYFPFFYVAFIKGLLFTHPGDEDTYDELEIRTDICNVVGCSYAITVGLLFVIILKSSVVKFYRSLKPLIKEHINGTQYLLKQLPAWERDFYLKPCKDMFLIAQYIGIFMQYGYVLFFTAALQLLPMLALITNMVNSRVDAIQIIKFHRRPVVKQLPGIGAFNKILYFVTVLGIAINAFVIAFTSDTWQREIYRYFNGHLDGFVNSTLSEFAIRDYHKNVSKIVESTGEEFEVCVYRGMRYPYYHEQKYQWTETQWHILMYKLGFVVLYEQILWLILAVVITFREKVPSNINKKIIKSKLKKKVAILEFLKAHEYSLNQEALLLQEILSPADGREYVYNKSKKDPNYYLPDFFVTKPNLYY